MGGTAWRLTWGNGEGGERSPRDGDVARAYLATMTQEFKLISSIEQRREADIVLPPICPFFPMSADLLQNLLRRYARPAVAEDQTPTG